MDDSVDKRTDRGGAGNCRTGRGRAATEAPIEDGLESGNDVDGGEDEEVIRKKTFVLYLSNTGHVGLFCIISLNTLSAKLRAVMVLFPGN